MTELSISHWEAFFSGHAEAHLLQSAAWADLKAGFGWRARRVACGQAGAQVLFRRIGLGLSAAYIPKGPIGQDWAVLWPEVDALCRREGAVFLKVEPDVWQPAPADFAPRCLPGFSPAAQTVQPPRSILVSLEGGDEAILGRMKQKTRYNIHLAEKKGVSVRPCTDVAIFHELMQVTGRRDGFGVHNLEYFRRAFDAFSQDGRCAILLAEYASQPLASLMVFRQGIRAWYFYGASNDLERNRMPAYLLQWEAMRWAVQNGCREYDLWGIPDADEATLEAQFTERSDGLWGVYRFKRGFGGEVRRSVGAWDRVYQPALYRLYQWWLRRRTDNHPL